MIGMPASTKTLSWREKCMISLRLTVFRVISNCRTLLCSLELGRLQARAGAARGARRRRTAAFSVPLTVWPASSVAS